MIKATICYGDKFAPDDWTENWGNMDPWEVTLRNGRRRLSVPFFTGEGLRGHGEPSAAGVLACLLSDAGVSADFEEFCSEFGYDVDSRKAERTHVACLAIRAKLEKFLGAEFDDALAGGEDWANEHASTESGGDE